MAVAGPRAGHEGNLAPARAMARRLWWPLALLTTGTSIALYAQVVTNARATHPSSQILAWTKYFANSIVSAGVGVFGLASRKPPTANNNNTVQGPTWLSEPERMCLAMGLLDVVAYSLNCMGFPLCGSALSMVVFAAAGQVFTAMTRTLLLGKRMSPQQQLAVAVVIIGLAARGAPWTLFMPPAEGQAAQPPMGSSQALGAAYLVASAACYSILGVMYEKLFTKFPQALSHAQVNLRLSGVGLLALTAYQALYTWPRRQRLVFDPMAQEGLTPGHVMVLLGAFGWMFTAHSYVQGQVLQHSGAMTVGIINALRAVTVTACSALLFCSPSAPHQCLTLAAALSAAFISAGVLLWSLANLSQKQQQKSDQTTASHEKKE